MKQCRLNFLAPQILTLALAPFLAQPAHAIECSKAVTKVEKTICSHPELLAEDKKLNEAYLKLLKKLDPIQRKAAIATQRSWVEDKLGDDEVSLDWNAIKRVVVSRTNFLSNTVEFTSGNLRLPQSVFIASSEDEKNLSAHVEFLQFYTPNTFAELRFNQEAVGLFSELGASQYFGFDWAGGFGHLESKASAEINVIMQTVVATENLLLVEAEWNDSSNGLPHPGFGKTSLIFDMKNAKALSFDDLFVEGTIDEMTELCLLQYKNFAWAGDENPPEDLSGYTAALAELGDWQFSPEGAIWVMSRPSNRPSYGWGCHLEAKILPKFARRSSIFWQELCKPELKFYSKETCNKLLPLN